MHDPHFTFDIDVLVIDTELGPDENHGGRWERVSWLDGKGGCVSLSGRAGAEIAALRLELLAVSVLLGSLLNTSTPAPLLSARPPAQRDRAFPGPAPPTYARQGMPASREFLGRLLALAR